MKVLELNAAKHVLWEVVDGPEEWIGTTVSWDLKQDGEHRGHPFRTPGLEGARRVHVPLQHEVGGLSVEPQVAPRIREGIPRAKRHQDRQLELTAVKKRRFPFLFDEGRSRRLCQPCRREVSLFSTSRFDSE